MNFSIGGRSDSDYAACKMMGRIVSGYDIYLEGASISVKSVIQKTVPLSVTEAELNPGVYCSQYIMYALRVLESMELKVELHILLEIENSGTGDLENNWSVGGRTRHIETLQHYFSDLKEEGYLVVKWISGEEKDTDISTKNISVPVFNRHIGAYCKDQQGIE